MVVIDSPVTDCQRVEELTKAITTLSKETRKARLAYLSGMYFYVVSDTQSE